MNNNPEEFFRTGLQTYLDAKAAVDLFEKEVQLRVKKAVIKHEHDLAESVGETLSLKDFLETVPESTHLGQRTSFKGWGGMDFYVDFSRDAEGPCAVPVASFWRDNLAILKPLWNAVRDSKEQSGNINLGVQNSIFYLTRDRRCDDWAACETIFDEVLDEWTDLWKTLGGLPKFCVF
jgi:hypothetical protein